jgi:hypothetical protein
MQNSKELPKLLFKKQTFLTDYVGLALIDAPTIRHPL